MFYIVQILLLMVSVSAKVIHLYKVNIWNHVFFKEE